MKALELCGVVAVPLSFARVIVIVVVGTGSPVAQPIARVTRRMMGLIFIAAVLATDMPASPAGLFPHGKLISSSSYRLNQGEECSEIGTCRFRF